MRGLSFLVVSLLLGGCVGQSPHEPNSSNPAGAGGQTSTSATSVVGVNMTGCSGSFAGGYLPSETVKKHLPPGYSPGGDTAQVNLYTYSCNTLLVDGVDLGRVELSYVVVGISTPKGAPDAPGTLNRFVTEIGVNNPTFAAWLQKWGVAPKVHNVTHDFYPLPGQSILQGISSEVTANASPAYSYEGAYQNSYIRKQHPERFFFGPDPQGDHFKIMVSTRVSGANGGTLNMAPGTSFYELAGGVSPLPVLLQKMEAVFLFIGPSASRLQA